MISLNHTTEMGNSINDSQKKSMLFFQIATKLQKKSGIPVQNWARHSPLGGFLGMVFDCHRGHLPRCLPPHTLTCWTLKIRDGHRGLADGLLLNMDEERWSPMELWPAARANSQKQNSFITKIGATICTVTFGSEAPDSSKTWWCFQMLLIGRIRNKHCTWTFAVGSYDDASRREYTGHVHGRLKFDDAGQFSG